MTIIFLAALQGLWHLSSSTTDRTQTLAVSRVLTTGTVRESPGLLFYFFKVETKMETREKSETYLTFNMKS